MPKLSFFPTFPSDSSVKSISRANNSKKYQPPLKIKFIRNVSVSLEDTPQSKYGCIIHSEKQRHITKAVEKEYGFSNPTLNTGVCLSASIHYLTKSLVNGTDYWSWLSDNSAKWEVVSQYLEDDYSLSSPMDSQLRMQQSIKDWGLSHVGTVQVHKGEYNSDELARVLTQGDGESYQGRLCMLSKENGPAHAIAVIKTEDGMIKLMDPDFGEMAFEDESELESWMENVFEKNYEFFDSAHVNYYSLT